MMARFAATAIAACLAAAILAIVFRANFPTCRADGAILFQVGRARYLVPAWMSAYPTFEDNLPGLRRRDILDRGGIGGFCQSEKIQVVRTLGFGFDTRAAKVRSNFPMNTPSIRHVDAVTPPSRPAGPPIEWRDVRSFSYGPVKMSSDRTSASIAMTIHEKSGRARRVEARCLYGEGRTPTSEWKRYVQRCSVFLRIAHDNVLEIVVNPGDDHPALGRVLIRTLRTVELISKDLGNGPPSRRTS